MVSAVLTTFIGYKIVLQAKKLKLAETFYIPEKTKISKTTCFWQLFGIGWGATGYCPGPSITALSTFNMDPLYFVIGMLLGSFIYWLIFDYPKK
ncbi:hypothetical protein FOLKNPGA_00537 [Legionella sp. PC1000]|uniref:DUF6691 family protein n=1 Tax=Legionella sp. PC1000 TaxID=2746060 RepID=UPI001862AD71|nr:hypothetical protein FOLKNPGA_00537 [Legionella sp. PC1000]